MQDQNLKSLLKKANDHVSRQGRTVDLLTRRAIEQAWLEAGLKIRNLFPMEAWKYLQFEQMDKYPDEEIRGRLVIFQDVPITFVVNKRVELKVGGEMSYTWEPACTNWLRIEGKEVMMVESDPLIAIAQANAWSEYGE